jgi:hypothetical protein
VRVLVFCVKHKNSINEPLYTPPLPEQSLNPYAKIIAATNERYIDCTINSHLREQARAAWLRSHHEGDSQQLLRAIKLGPREPGVVLAGWPEELPGAGEMGPRYGSVVTRTLGEGRLIFWQLPLGDWTAAPRRQQLLLNAVDYMLTEPAPTPPPAERKQHRGQGQAGSRSDERGNNKLLNSGAR